MQDSKLKKIFNKYNLDLNDEKYLTKVITPIINHNEFKRRMSDKFLHHGSITLGEHILEDTVLAYLMAKKKKVNVDLVVKIALFHDLYTIPWQNNQDAHVRHFFNKHGFRHPIEAVINAISWYPSYFNDDAEIIVDGILHHMFPLPVRSSNLTNFGKIELKNNNAFNKLTDSYQKMIINSIERGKIGGISIARSKYQEGRIVSLADKKVSLRQIKNFASFTSLFTGHNRSLKK